MPRNSICDVCHRAFDENEEAGTANICEACYLGYDDGSPMPEDEER